MTPFRAKRNSKAPERFSSDDIKTDSAIGASNSNHGDKSNSTAGSKFKIMHHEPIKVKLPKLKRAQQSPSVAKDFSETNYGTILAKIKLPPKKTIQRSKESPKTLNDSANNVHAVSRSTPNSEAKPTSHKRSDLSLLASSSHKLGNETSSRLVAQEAKKDLPKDHFVRQLERDTEAEPTSEVGIEKRTESGIRCACGVDDDLGVMVECEKCSNWQHGHCINVGQEEDAYEGYICAYCLLPPGTHRDSLHQLAINDKFRSKFEALEASMKVRNDDEADTDTSAPSQASFSFDELHVATSDLRRVANSLEAKWRLLISDDYNAELKIWTNPIWSDDPEENRKQQQETVRFVGDIYKGNLKINICSMLNRMHKRCQLIRYQISRVDTSEEETQSRYDKLLATLDQIANIIEKVTDNLRTI